VELAVFGGWSVWNWLFGRWSVLNWLCLVSGECGIGCVW